MKRYLSVTAVVLCLVVVAAAPVRGDVLAYHDYVQGLSATIMQYDFDGATAAERKSDKAGSNDLLEYATPTYGLAGFDSSSEAAGIVAGTPANAQGGFYTSSAVTMPATGASFEAIVKVVGDIDNVSRYVAAAYNGSSRYYPALHRDGTWKASAGSPAYVADGFPVTQDHWVYIATTYVYDAGSNTTTTHMYLADLTAGDTSLTHYTGTSTGTFSFSAQIGIGGVYYAGNLLYAATSHIDEVAFYNDAMDDSFFQNNLDLINTVPEPGTCALVGMSIVGLLAVGGRTRK